MMRFPKISGCLICEDVRIEQNGKSTLTGVYGLLPSVDIIVANLDKPIDRITFLVFAGRGEGKYSLTCQVIRPDGSAAFKFENANAEFSEPNRNHSFGLGISQLVFKAAGEFKFILLADGETVFESSFQVSISPPEGAPARS